MSFGLIQNVVGKGVVLLREDEALGIWLLDRGHFCLEKVSVYVCGTRVHGTYSLSWLSRHSICQGASTLARGLLKHHVGHRWAVINVELSVHASNNVRFSLCSSHNEHQTR